MNEREKHLYLVYEIAQLSGLEHRLRAGEELEVIALEYEVELELKKRGIAYAPLRSVAESCEGQREPIEVTRTAANEWYKHPELAFFAHDGILLGEPHAGPLHHYFGMLVYYLVLLEQIMARPGIERIVIPETFHTVGERADPTAYFKERVQVDVARMVAERRGIAIEVLPAPPPPAQSAAWAGPCGAGESAFIIRSTLPAARCARSRARGQKSLRARGTRSERARKYPNSSHITAVLFGCSQKMSSELSSRTTERMLLQRLRAPSVLCPAMALIASCFFLRSRDTITSSRGSRSA